MKGAVIHLFEVTILYSILPEDSLSWISSKQRLNLKNGYLTVNHLQNDMSVF
jgi:hypothetical protein